MTTDLTIPALLSRLDERAAEFKADRKAGRMTEEEYLGMLDFLDDQRFRLEMIAA